METKKLGEIVTFRGGGTPSKQNPSYWNGNIPWASVKDIKGDYLEKTESKITKEGVKNSSTKVCSADDLILVTRISPGKSVISKIDSAINQDLKIVEVNGDIDKMFLHYYFKSQVKEIEKKSSGTTVLGISLNELNRLEIPVPPLPTQHRIVEKIEELFSELDHGVENLKKAQKQLKTYRQAVLKDAFKGKLTKDWRDLRQAQDADGLSTPEELLEQIKDEREAHRKRELAEWEKEVEQWEKDGKKGRKPSKPRKVNEVEPISEKKLYKLAELPSNWLWVKLGRVIDQPKYGTSKKCDYDFDGYGVLRIPNIGKGIIDSEDMKYAPLEEDEAFKYALQKGDILTIRSNGSIDLVGKCALIREPDTKYLHAGYLIRLRPYDKVAKPRYLLNVLSSASLRSQIESKAKSTSGVNNINSGELQDLIIPICSVDEQKEIVTEIESRLSVVDQLEQTINENLQKAEALRQSILKKAFSGELVKEEIK